MAKEATMNKHQITTIQKVMGFTVEQAQDLIKVMDMFGEHPDWSEATDRQLRNHFNLILAGE
jgi:hypothetical protein